MDDATIFERLLRAEDEAVVEEVLKRAGYGLENESVWRPLGGMENNFSTVGNQQTEATAALVEKIINGIDAVLMAECFRGNVDPEGANAPTTMAAAVQEFFKVRDGLLANIDAQRRTELAKNIHLIAVGEKSAPCYLVVDMGEGQTPDSFPETFLSINRSNKLRIPFVQGKFNSGGTGVLQFCGQHNMQLIVSRRHPDAPVRQEDSSRNLWGFTIVRRMRPSAGRRNSMYVYLAPNNKVPRFWAETLDVLPEDRSKIAPRPYASGLPYGTCVKLYNFRWKARSIATTEARYELERFLHTPCLPFRLTEAREYKAHYFSTTVSGVWATIGSDDAPEDSKVEDGFPAYADVDLQGVGRLPYRMAVFRDTVNPRHVPHGVFFTVNGQVHGSLPSDFISRNLKFDYLKDYLLVSVDCTAMDPTVREDFFMASRDRVRKNEVYEEVVEHLREALKDHPGLRQLNATRRKKEIENTLTNEDETKKLFNELLKADPMLARLFGSGDRLITKTGPGPEQPFNGKKFPTYFRLVKDPAGGLVKHCPVNLTCRVEFETDAINDYFKRPDCPGTIIVEPPNIIEHSHLWNGRFTVQFRTPWDTTPGERIDVKITVEDVQTQTRNAPFVSRFTLLADAETERSSRPGNGRVSRSKPGSSVSAPTLAVPEVKEMAFGKPQPSLEVRHDGNDGLEYFMNTDNAYLVTELTRAKEEDKPLVKFWFKYGLLLCALGMLKEQQERDEAKAEVKEELDDEDENRATDELEQVSLYCDGIARVIIPIIRTLYRGPKFAET
ncbi:MAG: hypothetical protein C3F08_00980 [Candidatus Methylomirabilota bacterium]|nr:MAG: hypothetical protein C3F08_00980 [candidate division NC10 bacterium]